MPITPSTPGAERALMVLDHYDSDPRQRWARLMDDLAELALDDGIVLSAVAIGAMAKAKWARRGPDSEELATEALGIPYARAEVVDGALVRICPECSERIPEPTDADGEAIGQPYADHYHAEHGALQAAR